MSWVSRVRTTSLETMVESPAAVSGWRYRVFESSGIIGSQRECQCVCLDVGLVFCDVDGGVIDGLAGYRPENGLCP